MREPLAIQRLRVAIEKRRWADVDWSSVVDGDAFTAEERTDILERLREDVGLVDRPKNSKSSWPFRLPQEIDESEKGAEHLRKAAEVLRASNLRDTISRERGFLVERRYWADIDWHQLLHDPEMSSDSAADLLRRLQNDVGEVEERDLMETIPRPRHPSEIEPTEERAWHRREAAKVLLDGLLELRASGDRDEATGALTPPTSTSRLQALLREARDEIFRRDEELLAKHDGEAGGSQGGRRRTRLRDLEAMPTVIRKGDGQPYRREGDLLRAIGKQGLDIADYEISTHEEGGYVALRNTYEDDLAEDDVSAEGISERGHLAKAIYAIREIKDLVRLYKGQASDPEQADWLEEAISDAALSGLSLGTHLRAALGKKVEAIADRPRKHGRVGAEARSAALKRDRDKIIGKMEEIMKRHPSYFVTNAARIAFKNGLGTSVEANRKRYERHVGQGRSKKSGQ